MMKKIISHMLIISILLASFPVTSFAFVTTPNPGWGATRPDITPERQNAADIIRNVMVPNIVDKMIEKFPAFEYLKDTSIVYGFELVDDFFQPIAAYVAASAVYSGGNPISVEHSLMVNLASPRLAILPDGNFQDRESVEHVIVHEMVHAFTFEGMRAGIGVDNEAYPLWFGEGVAQAIGGDSRMIYDISLGLDLGAASSDIDIKGALAKLPDGDSTSAYAIGYLASMYLSYLTNGEKGINSTDISSGLNTIFAEILSGTSLDETIAKHTHYSGIADFELNFQNDTKAYDFVRALFRAIPNRREEKGGALFGDTLMSLDIVSDVRTEVPSKLFEISDEYTIIDNYYPRGVEILGGGSKNLSGKPQVPGYPKPPSTKVALNAPNLTLTKTVDELVATWDNVLNAQLYEIHIYTKDKTIVELTKTTDTRYTIPLPDKTGNYIFSVKALPAINDNNHYAGKLSLKEYDFVAMPTLKSKGADFITINAEFNQEYSIDGGKIWVAPPSSNRPNKPGDIVDFNFNGLNPGEEYNIITRVKSKKTLSLPLVVSTNILAPVITTLALVDGVESEAYTQTLQHSGAVQVVWSITSGALPNGINLNSNIISGTTQDVGTFNITVRAENSAGFDTKNLQLIINKKNVSLSIDKIANETFTGTAIKPAIIVKNGTQVLIESVDFTVDYTNNINVGIANVNVLGIGTYAGEVANATFNIIKATLAKQSAIEKHFFSTDIPKNDTFDVSSVVPANKGLATYTLGTIIDKNSILNNIPTINGSIVSFSINSGNAGDEATIPIDITMENYNDVTIDIMIKLTSKLNADSTIIFDDIQIKYGDDYSPDAQTSVSNPGAWKYSYLGQGATSYGPSQTKPKLAGTYIVTATFENSTHRGEKASNLIIDKIKPILDFPTASSIKYGDSLGTSNLLNNIGLGTFSWSNPSIFPSVQNIGYNAVFKPNDIINYDWTSVPGWNQASNEAVSIVQISVIPKELIITADDKKMEPAGLKPIYTATIQGLVLSDTIKDIIFTDDMGNNLEGIFKIIPSGGSISSDNSNYAINYIDGRLTALDTSIINIVASAGDGGEISPSGNISVNKNENKTFKITPKFGYKIKDVIINGVSKGSITSYEFIKLDNDSSISAIFSYNGINSSNGGNSSNINGSGSNNSNNDFIPAINNVENIEENNEKNPANPSEIKPDINTSLENNAVNNNAGNPLKTDKNNTIVKSQNSGIENQNINSLEEVELDIKKEEKEDINSNLENTDTNKADTNNTDTNNANTNNTGTNPLTATIIAIVALFGLSSLVIFLKRKK